MQAVAETLTMSERSLPVSLKNVYLARLGKALCQAQLFPVMASVHLGFLERRIGKSGTLDFV